MVSQRYFRDRRMSRYDHRTRDGDEQDAGGLARSQGGSGERPIRERRTERTDDQSRVSRRQTNRIPADALQLPRTPERQPVSVRGRTYQLRGSEAELLATVGAFRVVPAEDLPGADDTRHGDLRHLADDGLIDRRQVFINGQPTTVVALTKHGRDLLEANRAPGSRAREQAYHAGFVKPREIAHDAQLYRLYRAEAARIHAHDGTIRRVVLDYELKRDYQKFLNRPKGADGPSVKDDRRAFAQLAELPLIDGHIELPDLRIEYETPDGLLAYRDVELVTEHYSRAQLAGKSAAGFSLYRAAAARGMSGRAGAGGSPVDPHYLDWLR
jgi:hypothetical protein